MVDDDEAEDDYRRKQKVDSIATINSPRFKPFQLSRMSIPLCLLTPMPMVRPTLACDLTKLEQEFVHGYRNGTCVFYVSTTNDKGDVLNLTSEDRASFNLHWRVEVEKFEAFLDSKPELGRLKNLRFFICDGNHRHITWMSHINRLHSTDPSWHINVDCIMLETKGHTGAVMQAMHDINKYVKFLFLVLSL